MSKFLLTDWQYHHSIFIEYHSMLHVDYSFHLPMHVEQRVLTGTIDIYLRHTLEPVEQMTRLNRDLTLHIHGLLKVAQPFVLAGFRQEHALILLAKPG